MSKEKLLSVNARTANARRLQQLLLDYHNYRLQRDEHPLAQDIDRLCDWQADRLKRTHNDLYSNQRYHEALDFLLKDLYSPKEFTRRDADLERVFPVIVKLLPDSALHTIADLVELNLLTQQLDEHIATVLREMRVERITEDNYAEAFRRCDNFASRRRQITLIDKTGHELEKYVKSRFVSFSLKITEGPAEIAGLGQLHNFLSRGFKAFKEMGGVSQLLRVIMQRESHILEQIQVNADSPFTLPDNLRAYA
ncbi:hypothetical protein [Hahella sp. HN01]|uniref:FFLEELY motif protein n=1 Tax=Hahella sp. HN01 TaxID=2847262 RepID=UPI001C1E9602|nr:hypothetical protein [Hahella sp. HN01]MBU6953151.1 hypothetical protein [Hahella sp. HN01]